MHVENDCKKEELMGFLGKLFGGGEKEYMALDPSSAGAQYLEKFRPQLEALVKKIDDRYEAVPSQNAVFVFLGKPPGMFGVAWFLEGDAEEHNLKKLIAKKGLSQRKTDMLLNKLRAIYAGKENEPRFSSEVAGKKVIVIPSDSFADGLYNVLHVMDE